MAALLVAIPAHWAQQMCLGMLLEALLLLLLLLQTPSQQVVAAWQGWDMEHAHVHVSRDRQQQRHTQTSGPQSVANLGAASVRAST